MALDTTNKITYQAIYMALFREFEAVKANGNKVPKVVFLCPFWDPFSTATSLYTNVYEPRLYSDLWYLWDGKPLLLADPDLCVPGYQFTSRKPHRAIGLATEEASDSRFMPTEPSLRSGVASQPGGHPLPAQHWY